MYVRAMVASGHGIHVSASMMSLCIMSSGGERRRVNKFPRDAFGRVGEHGAQGVGPFVLGNPISGLIEKKQVHVMLFVKTSWGFFTFQST